MELFLAYLKVKVSCLLFVDMESAPSFKMNVIKEWSDVDGNYN